VHGVSEGVGLGMPGSEVVGAWFGAGSNLFGHPEPDVSDEPRRATQATVGVGLGVDVNADKWRGLPVTEEALEIVTVPRACGLR